MDFLNNASLPPKINTFGFLHEEVGIFSSQNQITATFGQ
jgi:hypothetical protein